MGLSEINNQSALRDNDPYFLAERLRFGSVHYDQDDLGGDGGGRELSRVWEPTESALADTDIGRPLDFRIEDSYFKAREIAMFGDTLQRRMQAQAYLANIDLLSLRAHGETIAPEDIQRSYLMMSQTIADNLEHYTDGKAKDIFAQMLTYALVARQADVMNIPFVTSPRESHSPWPQKNHDLYTVDDNMTIKTAVHVQAQKTPRPHPGKADAFVLTHYSENFIAENSADLAYISKRFQSDPMTPRNIIVGELIAHEPADGYPPESHEAIALSLLSARLIAKLNNRRLQVLGLPTKTTPQPATEKITSPDVPALAPPQQPKQPASHAPQPKLSDSCAPTQKLGEPLLLMRYYGHEVINPYLAAEHIPGPILKQDRVEKGDLIHYLWKSVEIGITTNDTGQIAAMGEWAQDVASEKLVHVQNRIPAAMLAANIGLLARRGDTVAPDPQDVRKSYEAMAGIIKDLEEERYGPVHVGIYRGALAELVTYCLVARAGDMRYVPYTASAREDKSQIIFANHDLYTLSTTPNAPKVALQVKYKYTQYHSELFGTPEQPKLRFIAPIYLKNTLDPYAEMFGLLPEENPSVNSTAKLIAQEAIRPYAEGSPEDHYLNSLSQVILSQIAAHRDSLLRTAKFHKMPYSTTASSDEYRKYSAA